MLYKIHNINIYKMQEIIYILVEQFMIIKDKNLIHILHNGQNNVIVKHL